MGYEESVRDLPVFLPLPLALPSTAFPFDLEDAEGGSSDSGSLSARVSRADTSWKWTICSYRSSERRAFTAGWWIYRISISDTDPKAR